MFGITDQHRVQLRFGNTDTADYDVTPEQLDDLRRRMLTGQLGAVELSHPGSASPVELVRVAAIDRMRPYTVPDRATAFVAAAIDPAGAVYLLDPDRAGIAWRVREPDSFSADAFALIEGEYVELEDLGEVTTAVADLTIVAVYQWATKSVDIIEPVDGSEPASLSSTAAEYVATKVGVVGGAEPMAYSG